MSFPRYPAYKDSGVEWLGEVPEHWAITRLKHVVIKTNAGEVIDRTHWGGDSELLYSCAIEPFPCDYEGFPEWKRTTTSDLLLTRNGTPYIHKPFEHSIYTNVVQRVVLTDSVDRNYMAKAAQNSADNLRGYGVSIESFNYEMWKELPLLLPSRLEQAAIAAFLDRETAKIDALVAEQERLIALLKEKRQAVCSHTVTKGLDPNAPMKPSGIEWLGDVPAHWEVKSIRHIVDAIGDVDHFMPTSAENGIPYLMTGDLRDFVSQVRFDACKKVSQSDYLELSKRIKTEKGDVVMARYATIGTLMYIDIDVQILVSYSSVTLKTKHSMISGMYLFHYMKSEAFRQGVECRVNTNTQANVGISDLLSLKAVVPPLREQATITAFLGQENAEIDALILEAEGGITLLKERRAALISAAVTGQIDVRGLAA